MLQGEKVLLRAISKDDLALLCEFNNDLEVELAGGGDPPMPQSLSRLEAEFDKKVSDGGRDGTTFAIEADGKLIGQCALFGFDQDAHNCEVGIMIGDKAFWGHGYGRDAIGLLLKYAFQYRNLHRVFLNVNSRNERGIRAYKACGFVEEGRLRDHVWSDGAYDDLVVMGVLRSEWENGN